MDIEIYKGFEITLDIQTGKFTGDGATNRNGKEFQSTSLPTLKKKINDFIKENQNFGAFKVRKSCKNSSAYISSLNDLLKLTTVKGVTSNRRLTVNNPDGRTATIGKYDINKYVLHNEKDDEIIKKAIDISSEAKEVYDKELAKAKALLETIEEKSLFNFLKEQGIEVDMNERGW